MTECKSIFLDTSPIIYYLQKDIRYYEVLSRFFLNATLERAKYITSDITIAEYLVLTYRENDIEALKDFEEFLTVSHTKIYHTSFAIANTAAKIRAEYKGFKAMDSLQLATAIHSEADLFLTNDKQLKQFQKIKCAIIDDFM